MDEGRVGSFDEVFRINDFRINDFRINDFRINDYNRRLQRIMLADNALIAIIFYISLYKKHKISP